MAGNVYEWISSLYKDFEGPFVVAGVHEKHIDTEEDLQAIRSANWSRP
jgi:hypothetical protein